jgi:hypothetical protein
MGAACSGQVCSGGTGGGSGGGSATGGGSGAMGGGSGAMGGGNGNMGGGTGGQGGIGGGGFNFNTPNVPIDFPMTCSFTACGGNIAAGNYFYTSACIGMDEFAPFTSQIEQFCGMGSTMISSVDGGISGFAVVQGTAALRSVKGSVEVKASITGMCGSSTFCGILSSQISSMGYMGSCAVSGSACDCDVVRAIDISDNGQFRTSGNSLTLVASQKTFDYCAMSGTVQTHETDAGTTDHEFGVATLTKQ